MSASTPNPSKPFVIPVFIPHAGCPHQCVFCNQKAITGQAQPPPLEKIEAHIEQFLGYCRPNRSTIQISYYGGNFLGLPLDQCADLLRLATRFVEDGAVTSLRFSTRPDTVTPERLEMLKEFPVGTVELGVQSMDDQVLQTACRGHTAADTCTAVRRLKDAGLDIGLQMMIGLPGDRPTTAMGSAQQLADLQPDFVRIYPTLVLANSRLARWYTQGRYRPLELEAAVDLTARLYRTFQRKKITVARMGLQASKELHLGEQRLAGPYHPAFGHLVYARIFRDKIVNHLKLKNKLSFKALEIKAHPSNLSRVRGHKNQNLAHYRAQFNLESVNLVPDPAVALDDVEIYCTG